MRRVLRGLEMVSLAVFIVISPLWGARPNRQSGNEPIHLMFLVPQGFHGWACVDFEVSGAPPLSIEGNALMINVRPGEDLKTSTKGPFPLFAEAQVEANSKRLPLPQGVNAPRQIYDVGPKDTVRRYCTFIGTVDEADAAGDAPMFAGSPRQSQSVSREERQALIALYKATNGDGWNHRFGWLGPPGTECTWHGVTCGDRFGNRNGVSDLDLSENNLAGPIPESLGKLIHLEDLELFENQLTGPIPESLSRLTHLKDLGVSGNHLTGMLPKAMIQRWLSGSLDVHAEDALLTDVSEISLESSASALLCGWRKIVLCSDRSATLMTKRCRKATPDDRTTYCEVKEGKLGWEGFARLAWLLERSGFYDLKPDYTRSITDSGLEITGVTRNGKLYQVSNYATAGPFELWTIQTAIEGAAASVVWDKTTSKPNCSPAEDSSPAGHD